MNIAADWYFFTCALIAVASAVATVALRSPLRAAMALLFHIIALAGLYLALHAHLLAALQLIVYAGAVVVLFIFVIMLLGPSVVATGSRRAIVSRSVGAALLLLLMMAIASSLSQVMAGRAPLIAACEESPEGPCATFGGVRAFARELFGASGGAPEVANAIVPFELVSILLLVAILGAIAVAKGRSSAPDPAFAGRRSAAKSIANKLKLSERKPKEQS